MIGQPRPIQENQSTDHFPTSYNLKIPLNETNECKSNSIDANLDRLQLHSPIQTRTMNFGREETKQPDYQARFMQAQQPVSGQKPRKSDPYAQYTPIKVLNSYSTDWKLKARITKKYPLRQWSSDKGSGHILNIDLIDKDNSQIQATFFNEAAEKFDKILRENAVYLFSNGIVKMANKRFTSIKNDHCLTFDINAEIEPIGDDIDIKH